MVINLPNILPINVVGVVSGTTDNNTPTSIFSRAAIQDVVIVNEDAITVNLGGSAISAASGAFSDSLTISGVPVSTTDAAGINNVVEDTTPELGGNLDALTRNIINVGTLSADTGNFADSLTISGVPVPLSIDEADISSVTVSGFGTDAETTLQGDVTLSGLGGTSVYAQGQTITVSGLSLDELEHLKSYGELFEENDSGTVLTVTTGGTYTQWTSTALGQISPDNTMEGSTTTDNLTVLAKGGGEYLLSYSATFSAAAVTNVWTVSVFRNGARVPGTDSQWNFSATNRRRTLATSTVVVLDVGDVVDLRFRSTDSSQSITLFRVNLSMIRIGRTGIGGTAAAGVTDHGNLDGLNDDDHEQYIRVDGLRNFSSTVGGITPTASNHLTTKGYVDGVSGTLQNQIKAFTGSDGITVTSGTSTIDIGGFRSEFVSASGFLQDNIDAIDSSVTLQEAYDNGDGSILTTAGKSVTITGVPSPDFGLKVLSSGVFSEGLRIARNINSLETQYSDIFTKDFRTIFHSVQDESDATGQSGGFQFDLGGRDQFADSFIVSSASDLSNNPSNALFVVRPTESGRVAIGNKSVPTHTLDVVGSGLISSSLEVGATASTVNIATDSITVSGQNIFPIRQHLGFSFGGELAVTISGSTPVFVPFDGEIVKAAVAVGTAPQGDSVDVQVRNITDSVDVFSSSVLSIPAASTSATTTTFLNPSVEEGDLLRLEIDQVGSTFAGEDLMVVLYVDTRTTPSS